MLQKRTPPLRAGDWPQAQRPSRHPGGAGREAKAEGGARDLDDRELPSSLATVKPHTRRTAMSDSLSRIPRGKTAPFFHASKTRRIIILAIFHGTPAAHRASGGSAGAGLAGGRFSCWVMSPQARALTTAAATSRLRTRASNRAGRERRATQKTIGRHGLAPRFPNSFTTMARPRKRGVALNRCAPHRLLPSGRRWPSEARSDEGSLEKRARPRVTSPEVATSVQHPSLRRPGRCLSMRADGSSALAQGGQGRRRTGSPQGEEKKNRRSLRPGGLVHIDRVERLTQPGRAARTAGCRRS